MAPHFVITALGGWKKTCPAVLTAGATIRNQRPSAVGRWGLGAFRNFPFQEEVLTKLSYSTLVSVNLEYGVLLKNVSCYHIQVGEG